MTSCISERIRKPIHYKIHQNQINDLFLTFNSIPRTEYFRITKSMDNDKLNIIYYGNKVHFDQTIINNSDTLKMLSNKINVDFEKFERIVKLIYLSQVISISATSKNSRIEIKHKSRLISIFALSENDYGYVFYPEKYDKTKNISKSIYYSNSIQ